jgi:hypothetical protein
MIDEICLGFQIKRLLFGFFLSLMNEHSSTRIIGVLDLQDELVITIVRYIDMHLRTSCFLTLRKVPLSLSIVHKWH